MRVTLKNLGVTALLMSAATSVSMAAIVVDGTKDASGYGSALTVQTNNTGFGDSTSGNSIDGGGSELDAAYGTISGGNLYLFLAGNIQAGGNRVNIFISSGAANGQSTLAATGTLANANGSKFSPGFTANYAYDVNVSGTNGYIDKYVLSTVAGASSNSYVGSIVAGSGTTGTITPGDAPTSMLVAIDNSNTGGVGGGAPSSPTAGAAAAVTTGIELAIPLADLGYTAGNIQVLADVNGGSDNYFANQFLAPLAGAPQNNLAAPTFDFSGTAGQYFTVVPEPASLSLLGLGAVGLLRRRK